MSQNGEGWKCTDWRLALVTSLLEILTIPVAVAQNPPQLQITSPVDGTVVNPGQSISISVVSPAGTSVAAVFVTSPLGSTATANSLPAQLSLTIPQGVALTKYLLTAVGATSAGQDLYSIPVTVDVERPDLPTRLTSLDRKIVFAGQRGSEPLSIYATFSDSAYLEVTESSDLTFASSNPSVATVDARGVVKPTGQGSATITATYTQGGQSVSVSIPVTVPKPVVTPSANALDFGSQNVGTSSAPQTVTLTNAVYDPAMVIGPVSALGDFSATDDCKSLSPIAPGTSCTATVIFTPTVSGPETGTPFVASSEGSMELTLTGTGVGPPREQARK